MLQVGQDLPLLPEALDHLGAVEARARHLDRDPLSIHVVGSRREKHLPHPATADLVDDLVDANAAADPSLRLFVGGNLRRWRLEEGARPIMGSQEGFYFSPELWIWTPMRQKGVAIGLLKTGVEQLANNPVPLFAHLAPPDGTGSPRRCRLNESARRPSPRFHAASESSMLASWPIRNVRWICSRRCVAGAVGQ